MLLLAATSETAHELVARALEGDRAAMYEILQRIEDETGRDPVEVLEQLLGEV